MGQVIPFLTVRGGAAVKGLSSLMLLTACSGTPTTAEIAEHCKVTEQALNAAKSYLASKPSGSLKKLGEKCWVRKSEDGHLTFASIEQPGQEQ
jgi:hypothetical protein